MDPPRRGEDGVHAVYVGSELPTDVPYVAHARDGAAIPFDPESDDETLAHLSRCARLYAAWAPYRKELVREAAETGLPVARHLFLHYPKEPAVRELSYQQYLLGTELLVAPVLDPGRRTVAVFLPEGRWVHVWSGEVHAAGPGGRKVAVAAPLGQPGLFFREGSAVGARFLAALREQKLIN